VNSLMPANFWDWLCVCCVPMLSLSAPEGWFVSGLTMKSPHRVSGTVIKCHVLCGHSAQLEWELILRSVSGDGDLGTEGRSIASATIITDVPYPLQLLKWGLPDRCPAVTSGCDGVTQDSTGERQGFWGLHQARSWLLKL
jgi:hypothetical protein